MIFLGIDIGTQGTRAVACDENGNVKASASHPFATLNTASDPLRKEQSPIVWWDSLALTLKEVTSALGNQKIESIAIDGTSGTVVPVDSDMNPLCDALMYNDARSGDHRSPSEEGKAAFDFFQLAFFVHRHNDAPVELNQLHKVATDEVVKFLQGFVGILGEFDFRDGLGDRVNFDCAHIFVS